MTLATFNNVLKPHYVNPADGGKPLPGGDQLDVTWDNIDVGGAYKRNKGKVKAIDPMAWEKMGPEDENPFEELDQRMRVALLAALPADDADLWQLHVDNGLGWTQIAAISGKKPDALRKQFARALERIKAMVPETAARVLREQQAADEAEWTARHTGEPRKIQEQHPLATLIKEKTPEEWAALRDIHQVVQA
jgi:hypothetical protein